MFFKNIFWLLKLIFKNIKISFFPNSSNIYRLLIKINNNCNYKCTTCNSWKNKKNNFITKKAAHKIAEKFKNKLFFLSITGGEPFLQRKRLVYFIKEIKKTNQDLRYISINTNCSLPLSIYKTAEKLLKDFPDLNLRLGLHYIPSKSWGFEETGNSSARANYKKTEKLLKILTKKYKKRFSFYKMITLGNKKNITFIEKEKDLWLNFAVTSSFYDNLKSETVQNLTKEEKVEIINYFLKKNKTSFLNKHYLLRLKDTIAEERRVNCYAGINRVYRDEKGKDFICSVGIKARKEMTQESCKNCWTACEAVFDFPPSLFLSTFFNFKKEKFPWN